MISRREFIAGSVALAVAPITAAKQVPQSGAVRVNDINSQLNSTRELAVLNTANATGRRLKIKQIISNVQCCVLLDATGTVHTCSRTENPELFRLIHGGYGLFGIITSVQLRLVPRKKIERVVEIRTVDG